MSEGRGTDFHLRPFVKRVCGCATGAASGNTRRGIALGVLLLLAAGCATSRISAQSQQFQPFFFIQMADPQLGMFDDNKSIDRDVKQFEQAIAHANRLHPDFVVICGDLINKPGDPAQEQAFLRACRQLDKRIPLYLVSGNHDVTNTPTTQSLDHYVQVMGRDYYAFDRHNCHFVVLNSTVLWKPQNAPRQRDAQLAWVRKDLAEVKSRATPPTHIVVFAHHSLFLERADEPDQYFNLPMEIRRPLLDLFHASGIKHVFAGHYHRCADARDGELEMTTSGPVGKPLGKDPSGFRIVIVKPDTIEHHYYPLDAVPDRVDVK
jgi:predicted phosphodiesterase